MLIALAAAIAHADVEITIRAELQLPAIVIADEVIDCEQDRLRIGIGHIGIVGRYGEARDRHGFVLLAHVVDKELPVRCVIGRESHVEQAALVGIG